MPIALMPGDQFQGSRVQVGPDHRLDKLLPPGHELCPRETGQGGQLKIEKFKDVQRALAVLHIKIIIAFGIPVGVDHVETDQEIGP